MSAIGWVDFSSEHREKVKSVIDLLSTPGVIDELGIGVIRDSFSDSLFPGVSTIQTRAKYFLTVPRIFKEYEKLPANHRRRQKLANFLNKYENRCMEEMVANNNGESGHQIIGASFVGKPGEVLRKPSSVYWTGIRQFGLIKTSLSLQAFCRKFANPNQPLQDLIQGTDKTKGDDPDGTEQVNETINIPAENDEDWLKNLSIDLSKDEAQFLSCQIAARVPLSLIGQILLDAEVRAHFLALPSEWNFTAFADEAAFLIKLLPPELNRVITAARDFWQLMHGAHIRYNCLLQERHGTNARRMEFESRWDDWLSKLKHFPWKRWETGFLWQLTKLHHRRVREHTVTFVESWNNGVRERADTERLDELVVRQERFNKKSRARLNPTALESVGDWVGIDDLNYRLNVVRTIVNDIHVGLASTEDEDA